MQTKQKEREGVGEWRGGQIIVDTQASLAHSITVPTDGHVMETTVGLNESEP